MLIKTIRNNVHPLNHFVYHSDFLIKNSDGSLKEIQVLIHPRSNSKAICSICNKRAPVYDTRMPYRLFRFVPLWNIPVSFIYAMRRVSCKKCGIKTEFIPWADGKSDLCNTYKSFLATWSKKLSWTEVAKTFKVSWSTVFDSVKHIVEYGLKHRDLSKIESIGVDEIKWKVGHKYLTVVYQLDKGNKRLLSVTKDRSVKSFLRFFMMIGKENSESIKFVCSDMWKPYLKVIRKKSPMQFIFLIDFISRNTLMKRLMRQERVM